MADKKITPLLTTSLATLFAVCFAYTPAVDAQVDMLAYNEVLSSMDDNSPTLVMDKAEARNDLYKILADSKTKPEDIRNIFNSAIKSYGAPVGFSDFDIRDANFLEECRADILNGTDLSVKNDVQAKELIDCMHEKDSVRERDEVGLKLILLALWTAGVVGVLVPRPDNRPLL